MTKFQKGQRVVVTLPNGKSIEGVYLNPYGNNGHSFYVNEFIGMGRNGEPIYKKVTYGFKGCSISPIESPSISKPSIQQYKAWLERAINLESRINESETLIEKIADGPDKEREIKKLERHRGKLKQIRKKIEDYEK